MERYPVAVLDAAALTDRDQHLVGRPTDLPPADPGAPIQAEIAEPR